jgi:hypothetical protein
VISTSQGRYLTQTQNKHKQTLTHIINKAAARMLGKYKGIFHIYIDGMLATSRPHVEVPAIGHLDNTSFLGFTLVFKEILRCFPSLKSLLRTSYAVLQT